MHGQEACTGLPPGTTGLPESLTRQQCCNGVRVAAGLGVYASCQTSCNGAALSEGQPQVLSICLRPFPGVAAPGSAVLAYKHRNNQATGFRGAKLARLSCCSSTALLQPRCGTTPQQQHHAQSHSRPRCSAQVLQNCRVISGSGACRPHTHRGDRPHRNSCKTGARCMLQKLLLRQLIGKCPDHLTFPAQQHVQHNTTSYTKHKLTAGPPRTAPSKFTSLTVGRGALTPACDLQHPSVCNWTGGFDWRL
jgi:hypothetical protein